MQTDTTQSTRAPGLWWSAPLLIGALLRSTGVPPLQGVGAFFTQWAWVIGIAAALLSFLGHFSIFGIGGKG